MFASTREFLPLNPVLTGEIRSQNHCIWNTFWTGGIVNPLEVIEQPNYFALLEAYDDLETAAELAISKG